MTEPKSGGIKLDTNTIVQTVLIALLISALGWGAAEMVGNKATLVRIEDKADNATKDIGRVEKAVGEMRDDVRSLTQRVYEQRQRSDDRQR